MEPLRDADGCAVAAFAVAEGTRDEVARLRAEPGPPLPVPPPPGSLLRHADEHTVLALAAVLRAAAAFPQIGASFADWGVIAAPRWQGRFGAAAVVERFRADGARGASPQAIPNLCLHAVSASLSLYLRAHGPNFGVGGGTGHVTDGLGAGLSAQQERTSPGTWLVLSAWDGDAADGVGRAVALALTPLGTDGARLSLSLERGIPPTGDGEPGRLADLAHFLSDPSARRWTCPLDGVGTLVLAEEP